MIKPQLENLTNHHIVTVTFKKKDGSIRTMRCTSAWEYLRAKDNSYRNYQKKGKGMPGKSLKYVLVWDLDAGGFRLINPLTVIKYVLEEKVRI